MRAKKKLKDPLAGKRDAISQLYRAVRRFIEENDGTCVVIGGIQIEQGVHDLKYNWQLCVRVTGQMPTFKQKEAA